ncbi:MAG: type II secretion system F family protein [Nitrospirae bacterium]|nr:type II secretion system F family protein [Nitrospirota bacterium]
MATFTYQARDEFGKIVRGAMSAESEDQLAGKLSNLGYVLTRTRMVKEKKKVLAPSGRIKRKDIIMFTHHLNTIEASGISIRVGLRDLAEQTENEKFRKVIENLLRDVEGGATLSEAMDKYPQIFSELYVSMIRAGEATGSLEDVLSRLAAQLEWQEETRGIITQAVIYPAFLLTAIIGLIIIVITVLVPRIMIIYTTTGSPLPLPTRILLSTSSFFRNQWIVILAGLIVSIITYKMIGRTPGGRLQIDRLKA